MKQVTLLTALCLMAALQAQDKRVPVIVVSGVSTSVNADAVIPKPIDLQQLFETVRFITR